MLRISALSLVMTVSALSAEIRYSITQLVPNDPNIGSATASSINAQGDVAGAFFLQGTAIARAYVNSSANGYSDLGFAGYTSGINQHGQIAAYGGGRAYRYTPGAGFTDLGNFPGFAPETGRINDSGQIAGTFTANTGLDRAFLHTDGQGIVDLGTLPGQNGSSAFGINNAGWVTGTSGDRAFIYQDGMGMTDIGPGRGFGINEAGVVVGRDLQTRPTIYMNGLTINLGVTGGALDINNHNHVVGTYDVENFMRGFVWSEEEGLQDLNTLVDPNSGWFLAAAGAVNDAGQIVGWGFSPERGTIPTPFLLTPIPEPSTWALLLLGTGALFFLRRRRA